MSKMYVGEVMADGTVVWWETDRPTSVEVHAADGRRLHGDEAAAVLVEVQARREAHPVTVAKLIDEAKARAALEGFKVSIEELAAEDFLDEALKAEPVKALDGAERDGS